ncbi:MAG: hypothetical protein A3F12_07665 [Gammaproteobacteria bacterium RIFCSPHIGHO2_12_FULL_38_14]|nr:MAG: hypothetical protein A3F12_07665 [Gammaproteobacteria bacterium RIFCSPHIGHO2_12_FULL_38_14]
MQQIANQLILIFLSVVVIYLLYALAPMLSPFLLGALFAYLANPLVKRLEKWHVNHLFSVTIVFTFFFGLLFLIIFLLFPIIQDQILQFINILPDIVKFVQKNILLRFSDIINVETIKQNFTSTLSKAGWFISAVLSTVLHSGYTFVTWLINIILIPVVTFYLLRDWDKLLQGIKHLLPQSTRSTVVKLAKECDEVLSAFFRGQLLVMLSLSIIYGVGLTLTGLSMGLLIGIIGGLLSLVPYLGTIFILIVAPVTAFIQFGYSSVLFWVFVVIGIGQLLDTVLLTPYLVGDRIGLHPVAVIFAILAGGTLFGFFGVLVALPVAAVALVLIRYMHHCYVK